MYPVCRVVRLTDFQKNYAKGIDVMYLFERRQRLTLSLWMSVNISFRTSIDETRGEEAVGPAKLKAENPWLRQVHLL